MEDDLIQQKSKEKTASPGKTATTAASSSLSNIYAKDDSSKPAVESRRVGRTSEASESGRDSLENNKKVAEEKETLSARVDAMQRDRINRLQARNRNFSRPIANVWS